MSPGVVKCYLTTKGWKGTSYFSPLKQEITLVATEQGRCRRRRRPASRVRAGGHTHGERVEAVIIGADPQVRAALKPEELEEDLLLDEGRAP